MFRDFCFSVRSSRWRLMVRESCPLLPPPFLERGRDKLLLEAFILPRFGTERNETDLVFLFVFMAIPRIYGQLYLLKGSDRSCCKECSAQKPSLLIKRECIWWEDLCVVKLTARRCNPSSESWSESVARYGAPEETFRLESRDREGSQWDATRRP